MKSTRFRVLCGLNYPDPKAKPDPQTGARPEKRVEVGDVIDDAPSHGTGRCGATCSRPGAHTWMLDNPDPVLAAVVDEAAKSEKAEPDAQG